MQLKSKNEIEIMAEGGHILALILHEMAAAAHAGTSTGDIDELALALCSRYKVEPACKGYMGFPAAYCSCVNDVVVHGIPSKKEVLKEGDIFTLDMVILHKGLMVDAAVTVPIGDVDGKTVDFLDTVRAARDLAIEKIKPGIRVGDISAVIEFIVRSRGYSPVREMTGHGIGREMHEEPYIPSYGEPGTGPVLKEGLVIAIEPIINKGKSPITISSADGWTARTKDGSISAVFEHTVAVVKDGHRILTI